MVAPIFNSTYGTKIREINHRNPIDDSRAFTVWSMVEFLGIILFNGFEYQFFPFVATNSKEEADEIDEFCDYLNGKNMSFPDLLQDISQIFIEFERVNFTKDSIDCSITIRNEDKTYRWNNNKFEEDW